MKKIKIIALSFIVASGSCPPAANVKSCGTRDK